MSDELYYKQSVFFTLQFEAIHCWPEAPEEVSFLRHPHRHLFKLECHCPVTHSDRDIEFIMMKRKVEQFCAALWEGRDVGRVSCEWIAMQILEHFSTIDKVTVSEDGENGATVWRNV